MASDDTGENDGTLGRIALKQVRVSRAEVEARGREGSGVRKAAGNPMNRLVPYLDLFNRLSDDELSRVARAPLSAVEGLRQQVDDVNRALCRYVDLLPRLSDDELVRLTGGTAKTIRFWRLSQPRHLQGDTRRRTDPSPPSSESGREREASAGHSGSHVVTTGPAVSPELSDLASGMFKVRETEEPASASQSATLVIDTFESGEY